MTLGHEPERRKGYRELYNELDSKVDEEFEKLRTQLRRFFAKALGAFAILGLASAIALAGFGLVLSKQGSTSKEIQQQRYDSLLLSCYQQNTRHDQAILTAGDILPEASQKVVKLLVDKLAPYEDDCGSYADRRVKGVPK